MLSPNRRYLRGPHLDLSKARSLPHTQHGSFAALASTRFSFVREQLPRNNNMEDSFFFIDGYQPNKKSKRMMRRHVMKGKNVGKTIHRRSRPGKRVDSVQISYLSSGLTRSDRAEHSLDENPRPWCSPRGSDFEHPCLTILFPGMEITPFSVNIIDKYFNFTIKRLFPLHLGLSLDDIQTKYLRMLLADNASYHCNLGVMQACNAIFSCDGRTPTKALYHISQALTQVNMRLQTPDAIVDSSIAMVLALISQEQLANQLENAEIHAKGLQKMVELRGGVCSLEANAPLALQVCKTDILLSLQHGKPTLFFRDSMPETLVHEKSLARHSMAPGLDRHYQVDPDLQSIFSNVMGLCTMLNNETRGPTLDFLGFEEVLISTCYRLLKFRPLLESRKNHGVSAMYHLGLISFMMSTFLQFNHQKIINHRLLSVCLQESSESQASENHGFLYFWFVMIAGIWVSNDEDGEWAIRRIRETTSLQSINTWDEAQRVLCMFPWVHDLHSQYGYELWSMARNAE